MRLGPGWLLIVALAVPAAASVPVLAEADSVISSVEIGDHGVLTGVPDGGLRIVDGPAVKLTDGFAEWYGVSYEGRSGQVERVGLGGSADWAIRQPVRSVLRSTRPDRLTTITRAVDLEIRTEFTMDDSGAYLLARVTLTNRGATTIRNLLYTREWRQAEETGWTFPERIRGLRSAPDDIRRQVWVLGSLLPAASKGLRFAYEEHDMSHQKATAGDVPLSLWTDGDYPDGLPVGGTNGISWGDYDADGYIDLFACHSGNLWRNAGGVTWEFAADLDTFLPSTERRYGSSFGDYNNDGLPDIGTECRVPFWGDDKMHLLKNLGGGPNFVDVAGDSLIIDVQPYHNSETMCWGDVDGDWNLDAFLPVYPPWVAAGPGNFFLFNLGPTGPGGAYRFTEMSEAAGLDNPPPDSARPEGAQFVDVDFDGDIDLYSNGTLYQNVSTLGVPLFNGMTETASGIGLSTSLEEGSMLFDYDMDGDNDLFAVYTEHGVRIWENYGDGTFFESDPDIVESPFIGLNLGMSAEDWDNDGDIDLTTRHVFRRNMLVEDGRRRFTVATHSIPDDHIHSATPAWGDWDKDGDLDCAIGNQTSEGHLYENTLYGPATPQGQRRHLRVRIVRDCPAVPGGLETEYGATARIHLLNGSDTLERRKFVASSHGYLNQNDYTLHFALPEDPDVEDPAEDLHFALSVDFSGLPADGLWRVDKHSNPVLGDIDLADLGSREIKVYRCGRVVIDGNAHDPIPMASARLTTTTGGLALATANEPLPPLTAEPFGDRFVGLAFDTLNATGSIRLSEIILDGQLDAPLTCGSDSFNIALWDVTEVGAPFIVGGGGLTGRTSLRNRRAYFRTDVVLGPGRAYRLVARIDATRGSPISAPVDHGGVTVLGGIKYTDNDPCSGVRVAEAEPDPTTTYLALRFGLVPSNDQLDPIGSALRVGKDAENNPVMQWPNLEAAAHHVFRCDAASGSCTPTFHAACSENTYVDTDTSPAPGEHFWYWVRAVNECIAGL